ncbi:MAG: peptidylprolyl isomerase [Proteobacteria bacterium]|nr:peptidylprolyl isomerase [Pseudomonadota bacterium]MDA1331693.1 peptidylprolyl isomerase [Pseudomonadota bacterium]
MALQVKVKTSMGDIVIELNEEKAPKTVENFLHYVDSGFYDGTIFHRVINGFMIQGGGMDANMKEKETQAPIKNEANNGLKNDTYTLAMARTNDVHSATSQFFINVSNNNFLNFSSETPQGHGYCVFAKVVGGEQTVDKIKGVSTGTSGFHQDVPNEAVIIENVARI